MLDLIRGRGVYAFWSLAQRIAATCLMAVLLLITPFLTATALDRTLPVEVKAINILPPKVHVGDRIDIEYTILRSRVCESRGESYIFDGANTRWPYDPSPWRVVNDDLGMESYKLPQRIPVGATPGPSRFRLVVYQRCPYNLFHLFWPIVDVIDSTPFEILPAR